MEAGFSVFGASGGASALGRLRSEVLGDLVVLRLGTAEKSGFVALQFLGLGEHSIVLFDGPGEGGQLAKPLVQSFQFAGVLGTILVERFAFGLSAGAVVTAQGGAPEPPGGVQLMSELVQAPIRVSLCVRVLRGGVRESTDFLDCFGACCQVPVLTTEGEHLRASARRCLLLSSMGLGLSLLRCRSGGSGSGNSLSDRITQRLIT
ncbi:hypothetical protein J7E95_34785, partial [Streptomyces sp. ISL-14]|nr:hypothetical protein [Streptomyces sp. ISL-14]